MTLKVRLTAMMVLLLVAVIALQFLLAERERRLIEERLSRLGSEMSRGTQQVVERARDFRWEGRHAMPGDSLLEQNLRIEENTAVSTRILVKRFGPTPGLAPAAEVRAEGALLLIEDSVATSDGRGFATRIERHLPSDSVEIMVERFLGDPQLDSLRGFVFNLHSGDGRHLADGRGRLRTDLVVNLPLPLHGLDTLYAVEMRFPTDDLLAELERSRRRSLGWMAAMIGVGVIGAALLATQFTRPIRDLRASFARVEQGDLAVQLRPERRDEIGQLTESFNQMVARLREQRGVEERLAEAERMASIGRMAAGVAHEVRNPLNAILLTLEQIREKAKGQDLERYHDIVATEVTRLERLVSTFLELARASELNRETHDVADGLRTAVELFRPEAERKGARLIASIESPLLLSGDRVRLPNVWNNLLSNAVAVIDAGGEVSLAARHETPCKQGPGNNAVADPSATMLVVTVTDSGPGIAPEILPRIWEPFFSGRKDGTGLGLSIVRSIVEAHGGSVEVEGSPLGRTTFRVTLPLG